MKTCENCGWRGKWMKNNSWVDRVIEYAQCLAPVPISNINGYKKTLVSQNGIINTDGSACPCWKVRGEG